MGLEPECSFNIGISFPSPFLSDPKLQNQVKKEIARVFDTAGVGVNFVTQGNGDYNLVVGGTLNVPPLYSVPSGAIGGTLTQNVRGETTYQNRGYVFVDRVSQFLYPVT